MPQLFKKSVWKSVLYATMWSRRGKLKEGISYCKHAIEKLFMPPGPAATKRWVYRNLPLLEKLKTNLGTHLFLDNTEYEFYRNTMKQK